MKAAASSLLCIFTLALAWPALAGSGAPELPKDFRVWTHTKSMVIPDKSHGLYGFHNIYANEKALKGLRRGKSFKEEAAFVVSFYEVVEEGGMLSQGKKIMDAVMIKDDDAKATEGWIYAAFGPEGRPLDLDPVKGCYECHAGGARDTDFVFHTYVE